jgi:hypothetical protein
MKFSFAAIALFVLSSCASPSGHLKVKKMATKDRIFAGRFLVDFNGKKAEDLKCELYVNSGLVPDIKLSADGFVFFKTTSSEFKISRIACYDQIDAYVAAWHVQRLPFQAFTRSSSNEVVSYFGDVVIQWKTEDSDTRMAAAKDTTSVQYPRIGRVEASGNMKIEIRSELEAISKILPERVSTLTETPLTIEAHPVQMIAQ